MKQELHLKWRKSGNRVCENPQEPFDYVDPDGVWPEGELTTENFTWCERCRDVIMWQQQTMMETFKEELEKEILDDGGTHDS